MRKLFVIAMAAFMMVASGSCKQKSDVYSAPDKVTGEFQKAFLTADFDNMYKLTVPRNHALIRNLQKMMRERPEKLEELHHNKVEIVEVKCQYENDTLTLCTCKYKINGNPGTAPYNVKKIDGKWLLDMTVN